MTLIISALSDDALIQVSDRRLTKPDCTLFTDDATKAICGMCADAKFSISYTGLARAGQFATDKPTDHCVVDVLIQSGALNGPFPNVVEQLRVAANRDFGTLIRKGVKTGVTFVILGFGPIGPFTVFLSNMEKSGGRLSTTAEAEFTASNYLRNTQKMQKLDISVCGSICAVNAKIQLMIKKFWKKGLRMSVEQRVDALVQIIRSAAADVNNGHFIGKNCMSVATTPVGDFVAKFHPEGYTPLAYLPHYINAECSFRDIWFSTDGNVRPKR